MKKKLSDQPAFPSIIFDEAGNDTKIEGLTKKQYFAAQIMSSLCNQMLDHEKAAKRAVKAAELLIKELEKAEENEEN